METKVKNMQMLIGGQWCDASNGAVQNNYNPYSGELLGTVPAATEEDIRRVIQLAVAGQQQWAAVHYLDREAIFTKFLALWDEHLEEIAQMNSLESGKPITQSRTEAASVKGAFRAYMNAAGAFCGESLPLNTDPRGVDDIVFTLNEPLGVCVCVGPYNFPLSIMAHKIAPALVTGNSVIMKPASDTPMATLMMAELLLKAGVTPNAVQCVTGSGGKLGQWFSASNEVAAVTLTGSTAVGVELMKSSSENLHHVMLELGGNDPLIVFADADVELAAREAFAGRIRHAGQVCVSNKRLIVHESVQEEFTALLLDHIRQLKIGAPSDPETEFGCLVSERAAIGVERQIKTTLEQGARCLYGGKRQGAVVEPTVLTDVTPDMDIAQNMEVFGPVFPIIGFRTFDEAVRIANNTVYGLSSGVITQDIKTAMKAATLLKAGTCVINGSGNYRQFNHAFGGVKMSGLGREGALYTLKEFTQVKTIVLKRVLA